MLFSINKQEWTGNVKNDVFAGLVSSIAILPEVIGFAIIAGVNPMTSLFASAVMMLVITFCGGRPAMVSAAAGSMALVMAKLMTTHGMAYMIAATILAGIIQLILGFLGIQKLMTFISQTVMSGFVNALAIMIFIAQIKQLPGQNFGTYLMVIVTVAMMYLLPKVIRSIPPALIIIVGMTLVTVVRPDLFQTVGDLGDMTQLSLSFSLPQVPLTWHTLGVILPTALALSMVGLIESLLTIPIVDQMTGSKSDSQREAKAQGLANIVTGLVGGPAGCAMIGQAVINVKSGARTRLSTLVAGSALLLLLVGFKSLMLQIPTAALIGIMIVVAIATFDWGSLQLVRSFQLTESFIMLMTVGIVVYTHNLAVGIFVGVLLSAVTLMVKLSRIDITVNEHQYRIAGCLFFGSVHHFKHYFEEVAIDATEILLDFTEVTILDQSGEKVVTEVISQLNYQGIKVKTSGLK